MKEKYLHSHFTQEIIGSAMRIHSALGPGLLESAYEECLEYELKKTGLLVERQIPVGIEYESLTVETAYRLDLLVEKRRLLN